MTQTKKPADGHIVGRDKDFEIIKKTLESFGFEDVSWINDITASFELKKDPSIRVWAHPADIDQREADFIKRFAITKGNQVTVDDDLMFEAESWSDLYQAIKKYVGGV
jgi:hypothetical protein